MKLDPVAQAVFDGLLAAYKNHKSLGEGGKTKDRINRFGDMALRADVEAEEKLFESLKSLAEKENLHIICRSEELGDQDVNPDGTKTYFAVFDGLDGSGNYLKNSEFGYGTMVAIAEGPDPKYEDFFVAGEAMMEEGEILIAVKNEAVYEFSADSQKSDKLAKFDANEAFDDSKTLANKYFPEELKAYGSKPWIMTGSTAWSIFSIASDTRFNGLIEVTRKKNLEQPILYLVATTLGGVMVDGKGDSIGSKNFKSWGQDRDGEEFLITAKNIKIASQILAEITRVHPL